MGGIWATWRFRIAENILLRYPRWPPQQPFWRSSIVSSPEAYAVVCWPLSVPHPCLSVTFSHFRHLHQNRIHLAAMAAILKVFSCYLLPNSKSEGAKTWWKASGQHGDLELLKLFHSGIQDGHHGSCLENLQITSVPEWLSLNDGRHWGDGNSELLKLFCSNVKIKQPSWNSSNYISSNTVSQIALKLEGRHRGNTEIQTLLNCSVPVSKIATMVAILQLFKQHQILNC